MPLPSRRIGRSSPNSNSNSKIQYPGPGRPEKKRDDDYLTPITAKTEVPMLLPPPKGSIKSRNRRSECTTPNLSETSKASKFHDDGDDTDIESNKQSKLPRAIPDITLSQLLTLGIDDLALKLNVPSSKLNTMTIVELTKYLSDYIENSSQKNVLVASESQTYVPVPMKTIPSSDFNKTQTATITSSSAPPLKTATETSAVFKVSFDDSNDATFIAKFDDNFEIDNDFIPNFDRFNQTNNSSTVDKYAVFREIIDQELKSENKSSFETKPSDGSNDASSEAESPLNDSENMPMNMSTKIDTKITEQISQAKDRYAALRDIILVEDLFEKQNATPSQLDGDKQLPENVDSSLNEDIDKDYDDAEHSSPDANISINLEDHDPDTDPLKTITTPTISQPILSSKDDLEIDEYMNRAISNLSLDSRDHLSPLSKSPASKQQNASISPLQLQNKKSSPIVGIEEEPDREKLHMVSLSAHQKTTLNDMSTSPIQLRISPITKFTSTESVKSKSPCFLSSDEKAANPILPIPTSPMTKSETESKAKAESNSGKNQEQISRSTIKPFSIFISIDIFVCFMIFQKLSLKLKKNHGQFLKQKKSNQPICQIQNRQKVSNIC